MSGLYDWRGYLGVGDPIKEVKVVTKRPMNRTLKKCLWFIGLYVVSLILMLIIIMVLRALLFTLPTWIDQVLAVAVSPAWAHAVWSAIPAWNRFLVL